MRSFLYGLASTAIALVVMYPVAYWIAFHGGRRKSVLLFIVLLPFFVSFVIRIISWQFILADNGIVLGALKDIGLLARELPRALDPGRGDRRAHLRRAAVHVPADLRRAREHRPRATSRPPPTSTASPRQQFLRVVLPLSAPGVYAGILLVAITNIGDYVSAAILGGPSTTMIGNIIQTQYVQNANYPVASALALILMVALLGAMFIYARAFGTRAIQEYV